METIQFDFTTGMGDIYYENGIIHAHLHPTAPNLEETKAHMNKLKEEYAGKLPALGLVISKKMTSSEKAVRDYIASEEVAKIYKAVAMVVPQSPMTKIIINLFLKFNKPEYPTKFFTNEEKAREWLEQYR